MTRPRVNATKTNHKTRLNYGTGLKKCINPHKCICRECKEKRRDFIDEYFKINRDRE
ncbi:MAG: hypothetical protein GY861_11735 [bacterium]|nr:hypothetical protein [bacterium]